MVIGYCYDVGCDDESEESENVLVNRKSANAKDEVTADCRCGHTYCAIFNSLEKHFIYIKIGSIESDIPVLVSSDFYFNFINQIPYYSNMNLTLTLERYDYHGFKIFIVICRACAIFLTRSWFHFRMLPFQFFQVHIRVTIW